MPQPTVPPQAAETSNLERFFQTGGQCISDVWSSSIPYNETLHQQVINYCATNKLGDWSYGIDPMDPKNYGASPANSAPAQEAPNAAEEMARCRALDIETAVSGDIQYCYMEYGISVGG